MTTAIQIRIDPKQKRDVMRILKKHGMTMSGAIKIFLGTVVTTQKVPVIADDPLYVKAAERLKQYKAGKLKTLTLEELMQKVDALENK